MHFTSGEILKQLSEKEQKKVEYFAKLLLKRRQLDALKKEIEARRKEISRGESLSHEEIWKESDV